mgnify:CR=1 FL=1
MTNYEIRPVTWHGGPVGVESYNEAVIEVRIQDETGGEFVEIIQSAETRPGFVTIGPEEWPALRAAINRAVRLCRDNAVFDAAKEAANANP